MNNMDSTSEIVKKEMNSSELVTEMAKFLDESKFEDISIIDLTAKTEIAEKMIVATGRSERHISSYAKRLVEMIKQNSAIIPSVEGLENADWVLVDVGFCIIHLFKKETRELYKLEKLWEGRKVK